MILLLLPDLGKWLVSNLKLCSLWLRYAVSLLACLTDLFVAFHHAVVVLSLSGVNVTFQQPASISGLSSCCLILLRIHVLRENAAFLVYGFLPSLFGFQIKWWLKTYIFLYHTCISRNQTKFQSTVRSCNDKDFVLFLFVFSLKILDNSKEH